MEEQKRVIAEEEALALETLPSARINNVPLPIETAAEFDAKVDKLRRQFPVFVSREDAEYFSMLPLSRTDSMAVLKRAMELQAEEEEHRDDWNKQSTSSK